MGIYHGWDNSQQTTYCMCCEADWSWADFRANLKAVFTEVACAPHCVDFILWFNSYLPKGNTISSYRRAGSDQPGNIYRTVIVACDFPFVNKLTRFINHIEGWDGPELFDSIDEARDWLVVQQMQMLDGCISTLR